MSMIEQLRLQRRLTIEDVARASQIELARLKEIEKTDSATAKEERLLAAALGVPEYALRTGANSVQPMPRDFRTEANRQPVYGLRGLRAIYEMQTLAEFANSISKELRVDQSFAKLRQKIDFERVEHSKAVVIEVLSQITGYGFNDVADASGPSDLFSSLRLSVESKNIFVVCERLTGETYRGFCINNTKFPIIYINTYNQTFRMRCFTLIHELVHLIVGESGIVDPFNYRSKIERFCNSVTAQFLLPEAEFHSFAKERERENPREWIELLARSLPFSRFFLALRIQEVFSRKGFVDDWLKSIPRAANAQSVVVRDDVHFIGDRALLELNSIDSELEDELEDENFRGKRTAASYQVGRLGDAVIALLDAALSARLISKYDVFDHLRVKTSVVDKAIKSARSRRARIKKLQ